eukprot:1346903-Rhodomonas_salina.2
MSPEQRESRYSASRCPTRILGVSGAATRILASSRTLTNANALHTSRIPDPPRVLQRPRQGHRERSKSLMSRDLHL